MGPVVIQGPESKSNRQIGILTRIPLHRRPVLKLNDNVLSIEFSSWNIDCEYSINPCLEVSFKSVFFPAPSLKALIFVCMYVCVNAYLTCNVACLITQLPVITPEVTVQSMGIP